MKILLVTSTLRPVSGWGTYSRITAEGLAERGHEVHVLCAEGSDAALPQRVALPDPLHLLRSPMALLKTAGALKKAIKEIRPDVVHFLVEPYALACPSGMPPWAMNLHGTYAALPFLKPFIRPLADRAFRGCGAFLACSNYTYQRAEDAVQRFGSAAALQRLADRTWHFRFGVPPPASVRARRLDPAMPHVLYVGAVKERKGVLELLRACAAYAKNGKPLRVTLAGDYAPGSPYVRQLEAVIEGSALKGRVTFAGRVTQDALEELYATADVLMMLSRSDGNAFEGYGLVFVEAALRAVPVIGSRDSGCQEAINEGVSGFVVNAEDAQQAAEKLRLILKEQAIAAQGCLAWGSAHSVAQQIALFEGVYEGFRTGRQVTAG